MSYLPAEECDLVHGLCKLFAEIDINGDAKMEWSEFTQYVIDALIQSPARKDASNQREVLEQADLGELPRFGESLTVDGCVHDGIVQRVGYCQGIDRMLFTENKSHTVKFVSSDMRKKEIIDLYAKDLDVYIKEEPTEEKLTGAENTYFVMAAAYNEAEQMVTNRFSHTMIDGMRLQQQDTTAIRDLREQSEARPNRADGWSAVRDLVPPAAPRLGHRQSCSRAAQFQQDGQIDSPALQYRYTVVLTEVDEEEGPTEESNITTALRGDKTRGPNFFNDWSFSAVGPAVSIFRTVHAHKAQIMDVVELKFPVAIATCSLDHKIKLWDLSTGEKLGSLSPQHTSGVRCLDYTPDFSGFIISVGHENYIKVWSPEVSIHQAFVGNLEGHSTAVVAAKFLLRSPHLASIDEKLTIRLWDIRTQTCLQILAQDRKKFECNGLCVAGPLEFVIYGRRLIMFDTFCDRTVAKAAQQARPADEVHPAGVLFNSFYKNFYVLTKYANSCSCDPRSDVRIYDGRTGRISQVFARLMKTAKGVELTAFCFDDRNRKLYLGDASGSVNVFNAGNGVRIRPVGEVEVTPSPKTAEKLKQKLITAPWAVRKAPWEDKAVRTDHVKEICAVKFVDADGQLVTASHDSTMNVYDESDPEGSHKLRSVFGGHFGFPITCMDYGHLLGLVATGASNGSVTVWDYEMSRVDGECHQHTREITAVRFVEPYPLLVSSGNDGLTCVWGVRGSGKDCACLCRLFNLRAADLGASFTNVKVLAAGLDGGCAVSRKFVCRTEESELKRDYLRCIHDETNTDKHDDELGEKHRAPPDRVEFLDLNSANNPSESKQMLLATGDEKGEIRLLELSMLARHFGVSAVTKGWRQQRPYFNPRRKGDFDVASHVHPQYCSYYFNQWGIAR